MNKILGTVLLLVVLIVLGFIFRTQILDLLFGSANTPQLSNTNTLEDPDPQMRLINTNSAYQQAEKLRESGGNSEEVISLYRQALEKTTDPEERGQIEFKIASTGVRLDPKASIEQLKVIVADPEQSDIQKAYAVQQLGETYFKNTNKDIVADIFSGDPYAGFYTSADVRLSLRKLYEYASSFYPLGISELRSAQWYANQVTFLKAGDSVSEDDQIKIDSYKNIVIEKIKRADEDIERTKNSPNAKNLIPTTLVLKAGVLTEFDLAGESIGDVDAAWQNAILENALVKGDGPPRVFYASYLARKYGSSRQSDIQAVLTPFMNNLDTYPEGAKIFLSAEKDNILDWKNRLITLAELVPDFKDALKTLGWDESDFVR